MNDNHFTEEEIKELKRVASYRSKGKKISKNPVYWVLLLGAPLLATIALFFLMSKDQRILGLISFGVIFGFGMILIYLLERSSHLKQ